MIKYIVIFIPFLKKIYRVCDCTIFLNFHDFRKKYPKNGKFNENDNTLYNNYMLLKCSKNNLSHWYRIHCVHQFKIPGVWRPFFQHWVYYQTEFVWRYLQTRGTTAKLEWIYDCMKITTTNRLVFLCLLCLITEIELRFVLSEDS